MLVHSTEKPLARIAFVYSTLFWVVAIVGTVGIGALVLAFVFIGYLFAQSGFVSYVRGNGIRVGREQLPELYERHLECCRRLDVDPVPEIYVLNAHGMLNALATRFLRRHYVILFSDVLDGLAGNPEAVDFYLGHELGHIRRGHLRWAGFLWPASLLPLLGTAYSRAREYTCDLHGLACCDVPKDAAYGLAVLAAGERSVENVDLRRFALQADDTGGFWMSFHELTSDYPWLSKRMRRLMAAGRPVRLPRRHLLAWPVAFLVPRTGMGAGSGAAGVMVVVATVGILAAIAIPNFLRFQARARLADVAPVRAQIESAGAAWIEETQAMPPSLSAMGLPDELSNKAVERVEIDGQSFVLHLRPELQESVGGGRVALTPYYEGQTLMWDCASDLDEALGAVACGEAAPPAAAASAPAQPSGTAQASGTAASGGGLAPNDATCSGEFRATPEWAALGSQAQEALRQACNLWKLERFESQMEAAGS